MDVFLNDVAPWALSIVEQFRDRFNKLMKREKALEEGEVHEGTATEN